MQCSKACYDLLYPFEERAKEMIKKTDENLTIPQKLVPLCPVCGETMELNLRKDSYFVQDDLWYKMNRKYGRVGSSTQVTKGMNYAEQFAK